MTDGLGMVVAAATDGACSGNPGPGGWGALIRYENGMVQELGGSELETTNNRMELKAALSVLEHLKDLPRHPDLKIRTDSKYLIDGFSKWMHSWKLKGWRTAAGKPVLNQDLWEALDRARLPGVSLAYVKGHSGDPDNERVDQIAVSFSKGSFVELRSLLNPKQVQMSCSSTREVELKELVSSHLQVILSKLEFANRLAQTGYAVSSFELSELVGEPLMEVAKKIEPWEWRNWLIEPLGNDLWRFNCLQNREVQTEDGEDDRS